MPVLAVIHEEPRDDSEALQQCPGHTSHDQRQRGGLSIQVEQQRRPLIEARRPPGVREEVLCGRRRVSDGAASMALDADDARAGS